MADQAVRAVLERLFLALGPPEMGVPRRGSLLVALTAEEGDGGHCIVTVGVAGGLSHRLDAEVLRGEIRGVQELSGVPDPPRTCCAPILRRAPLRMAFELRPPPGSVSPDALTLHQFLHRTSLVHPEVEFHVCVSVNGDVTSRTYGRESPGGTSGTSLRVQSWHFTEPCPPGCPPPCSRIHPVAGSPVPLRVPPPVAAAGLGGDISLVPRAAICPCLRPFPNRASRLRAIALFLYDPLGLPVAPVPPLLRDPSSLGDLGVPCLVPGGGDNPPSELVAPDVTYVLGGGQGGSPKSGGDSHPQTLLLFLRLRHRDPFQGYDTATHRLLLAHLEQTLWGNRKGLASGLRSLLQPPLRDLRRRHQDQQKVARSFPVAVAALTSVVATSASARFRRACLGAMKVEDTPALVVATQRRLASVTQGRRVPSPSCDTPKETEVRDGPVQPV